MRHITVFLLILFALLCYIIVFKPNQHIGEDMQLMNTMETSSTYELVFDQIDLTEIKDLNKSDYAYVTLLFPSYSNGVKGYKFILGMLVVAYLLKNYPHNYGLMQNSINSTKASVVCMVTPDVDNDVIELLNKFYDRVVKVPYISSSSQGLSDSIIINDVTKGEYPKNHAFNKVMTKLHMFNPDIMPYKKIIFLDGDMLPLSYFDTLFSLQAPAGWLETYRFAGLTNLSHGKLIAKECTDINLAGSDINASLLVIEPNRETYNSMIKELQSPLDTWFGKGKPHDGMFFFVHHDNYLFPEQNYLTKRFSGQWTYVDSSFCACIETVDSCFGISLAGVYDKIWILQSLNHRFTLYSIFNGISGYGSLRSIEYTYKLYNDCIYDVLYALRDNPRQVNIILQNSLFVTNEPFNCFTSAPIDGKLYNVQDTSLLSDDQLKLHTLINNIR